MAAAHDAGLPGISSFAKGLEQDLDAVTNGLTMNWSSGPVDHIKMIKRQDFHEIGVRSSFAPSPTNRWSLGLPMREPADQLETHRTLGWRSRPRGPGTSRLGGVN